VDLGVDLRIVQLFGHGVVGTTWLWIQPHFSRPLMERLGARSLAPPVATIEQPRARAIACGGPS
jgi:hypothetical protein